MELQLQLWGSGIFHLLQDGNEVLSLRRLSAVLWSTLLLNCSEQCGEMRRDLLPLRVSGCFSSGFVSPRELGDIQPPACSLGKAWFGCEGLASNNCWVSWYRNFALGTGGKIHYIVSDVGFKPPCAHICVIHILPIFFQDFLQLRLLFFCFSLSLAVNELTFSLPIS